MRRSPRLLLVALVTVTAVGCDQATKHVARVALAAAPGVSLLGNSLHFELVENRGGFLSLGADSPRVLRQILFAGLVPALLGVVAFAAIFGRAFRLGQVVGLALILGGGIGNLIDRILNDGAVTDFVRLGIGAISTGIFNVGDVAILLGVGAIAFGGNADEERRDAAGADS